MKLFDLMNFDFHYFQRGVHLVSVVEGLGQLLTDVAVGKRKLGLSFLSKFLLLLKPYFLNEVTDTIHLEVKRLEFSWLNLMTKI